MIMRSNLYKNVLDKVAKRIFDEAKDDAKSGIQRLVMLTGVPVAAVYQYAIQFVYGEREDLVQGLENIKKFYGYEEIQKFEESEKSS